MDIDEVFGAKPISIERLLHEPGQCFYIPAYQRPFSWDANHITRLFDDIAHGITELLGSPNAITFLGTIITIHDVQYTTVDPKVVEQLPARVMTVIDGQQRLTTLLLLVAALHNELTVRHQKFEKGSEVTDKWIANKIKETYSILGRILEDDRDFGDHQYYPRMTRAYDDRWSRWEKELAYESPIAEFLFKYGNYKRSSLNKQYTHDGEAKIKTRYNQMKRLLKSSIAQPNEDEDIQFPNTRDIVGSPHLSEELLKGKLPDNVRALLLETEDSPFTEVFRLLVFSRFVLQRLVVTIVIAKSEEYAFDMFEALNTTGEPLTAIETFKPRIIQAEGHKNYQGSRSFEEMEEIERYLDRFNTAPARQTATADLLIPFALAETGEKLSKRLTEQRRYLMKNYDVYGDDIEAKRNFVRHLARTSIVVDKAWRPASGVPDLPGLKLETEDKLCISVLRAANHHIVLGPLARFYSLARSGDIEPEQVGEALRAMTGFFGLWRGAFQGTHNIDSRYRTLMAEGSSGSKVFPFARTLDQDPRKGKHISAKMLRKYMAEALSAEGINTKEDWVSRVAEKNVYEESQALTRLLLLAATHNSIPDENLPGLIKAGTEDVLKLLNHGTWHDEGMVSVEHIAPQKDTKDWDSRLYIRDETIHRLGNLVLIPQEENSAISNANWDVKRVCFKILSARSIDEAEKVKKDAISMQISIPKSILEPEEGRRYRPLSAGVARFEGEWGPKIIDERSKRLAALAWDRLAPWVGLP